jgi:MFS transporter, ACS family, hexuronate transporter
MVVTTASFPKALQWKIVVFIFIITIINYFDRSAISYAILPLEKTFNINHQQFGFIASAFGIGYFLMCFFAGLLVDRFGPIKMWGISAIVW